MKINYLGFLLLFLIGTPLLFSQQVEKSIDQVMVQLQEDAKLSAEDVQWKITDQHISSVSGVKKAKS